MPTDEETLLPRIGKCKKPRRNQILEANRLAPSGQGAHKKMTHDASMHGHRLVNEEITGQERRSVYG